MNGGGAGLSASDVTEVVTAFLRHDGRILVLRRSDAVETYRGRWAGVSGYLEQAPLDQAPLDQALTEIAEETGLGPADVTLVKAGDPLLVHDRDADRKWRVHPFLFEVRDPTRIRLDWEHRERRWAWPAEIDDLDTVPALAETLRRVYD